MGYTSQAESGTAACSQGFPVVFDGIKRDDPFDVAKAPEELAVGADVTPGRR
jgi:hypothetical protein